MREFTLTIGICRCELEGLDFKEMLSYVTILQNLDILIVSRCSVKHMCLKKLNNDRYLTFLQ